MRLTVVSLVLLTLCSCGGSAVDPTPHLHGDWGGEGIALSADRDGAFLTLTCLRATTPRLVPRAGRRFTVPAVVVWQSWGGPTPELDVEGEVTQAGLDLVVLYRWPNGEVAEQEYQLRAGADPDLGGLCLA